MRTFRKHERSVLKRTLPKKPKVRANVVGSAKVPRQRQRKPPQTRRSGVESTRALC
jgi:hypothetical protein